MTSSNVTALYNYDYTWDVFLHEKYEITYYNVYMMPVTGFALQLQYLHPMEGGLQGVCP